MKNQARFLLVTTAAIIALWLNNSSLLHSLDQTGEAKVLAHRGVHQNFSRAGLKGDTCTATRIDAPHHEYLENTIPSMQAAFAAGADVVELDVHLTPDGVFAVFHDWTLECRTDATGVTEETPFSVLRTLDVGYGYTADGGKTFPFRGKAAGMMPQLEDVFAAFPEGRFLINFKSSRSEEGDALAALLAKNPKYRDQVFAVYGGGPPTEAAIAATAGLTGYTKASLKNCLVRYMLIGWSGYVPAKCENQLVVAPSNLAWLLWGWPDLFQKRMSSAATQVILVGPLGDEGFTSGVDSAQQVADIPAGFNGYVWTNAVEMTGEKIKRDSRIKWQSKAATSSN